MQPIKQLKGTMLETMTTLFTDTKDKVSGKDLKVIFNDYVFSEKRNNDIEKTLKDLLKEKNITLSDKAIKEIAYLHQLYSDPNSSRLGQVKEDDVANFRNFMKGSFEGARKAAKYAKPAAGAPETLEERPPKRQPESSARSEAPAAEAIKQKFEPQKRHPQFEAWSGVLKTHTYDETLDWLALYADIPVSKQTSREDKVLQIMEKLQDRREIDMLPSLLTALGAFNVALKMGGFTQQNLSNSRIVLIYKMFQKIDASSLSNLYMMTGAPKNPSIPAPQQFASLFEKYSADQMYALCNDPLLNLAHVREFINPIYNAGAILSAALQPPPQPAASVRQAPSQPTAIAPQPLETPTQQYAQWAKILEMKASNDALDSLALHTEVPVNRFTDRGVKVEQIMQKLQSRRELDLLPSLLRELGERKTADLMGDAPLKDVSSYRTVLLSKMLNQIDYDATRNLYRLVGMPQDTPDSPIKKFSNLVEFNTAETLKELFEDPSVGLTYLLRDVDALYGSSSGIPSAALGTGNRKAAPPAAANVSTSEATKGKYAPAPFDDLPQAIGKNAPQAAKIAPFDDLPQPTAELDAVEKAYEPYRNNKNPSHQDYVLCKIQMGDQLDEQMVKRLVQHYQAPVRIQSGFDFMEWLTGRAILTNKRESFEQFLAVYRKYRQAPSATPQPSEGSSGNINLIDQAYQTFLSSKRDHQAYVMFKFSFDDYLSPDSVKRLVRYYNAPVRLNTGGDLVSWLEGQGDATGKSRFRNDPASIQQFLNDIRRFG